MPFSLWKPWIRSESHGQDSSTRRIGLGSLRVKGALHRRKSLADIFPSVSPRKKREDEITCQERIHYPLYDAQNPSHNTEARQRWRTSRISVGASRSGSPRANSPTSPPKSRRSLRRSFVSLTGTIRLKGIFSRKQKPSKPDLASVWEPQSPSHIGPNQASNMHLWGNIGDPHLIDGLEIPDPLLPRRPYVLPSLPSMGSELMSPLALEACGMQVYEGHQEANMETRVLDPLSMNTAIRPADILSHTVYSPQCSQDLVEGPNGHISNRQDYSENHLFPPKCNRIYEEQLPTSRSGETSSAAHSYKDPFHRNHSQDCLVSGPRRTNLSPSLDKPAPSQLPTPQDPKIGEPSLSVILGEDEKPVSTPRLGKRWLESRHGNCCAASPDISQQSTASDSEFGYELHTTRARDRGPWTPESDQVFTWYSSMTSGSNRKENRHFSRSSLSPCPPSSRDPSGAKSSEFLAPPEIRCRDGNVTDQSPARNSDDPRFQGQRLSGMVPTDNRIVVKKTRESSSRPVRPRSEQIRAPMNPRAFSNLASTMDPRHTSNIFSENYSPQRQLTPNSAADSNQSLEALRDQLCESSPEISAKDIAFWPESIDSCVENDKLRDYMESNIPSNRSSDTYDVEKLNSLIPTKQVARTPSLDIKARNISSHAAVKPDTPVPSTSHLARESTCTDIPVSGGIQETRACSGRSRKPSSSRNQDSSSGTGGSSQSDPLTNSTAGTSIVDFPGEQMASSKDLRKEPLILEDTNNEQTQGPTIVQ
ncbi:hypothetical protein FQN55_000919 [Onygenales sp. PD_40]|nr:hypothetical protein FQN55_000919 [Onygenales sp. PD_40]KAK2758421.1 hypothetical protein FQN53_008258 [Emmonsiellopsis sp. PD_33]KAK2789356.1 hypothetical protein FQN52_006220 [Onygenales sp. PD_12]KAK2800305.1 hypothetical protein FQN51_006213 [Onygenales sp. PD_10]